MSKRETIESLATEIVGVTADGRVLLDNGLFEPVVPDPENVGGNEMSRRRRLISRRMRVVSLLAKLVGDGQ